MTKPPYFIGYQQVTDAKFIPYYNVPRDGTWIEDTWPAKKLLDNGISIPPTPSLAEWQKGNA